MKLLNTLLIVAFLCLTMYSSWNGRVEAEDDIEAPDESSEPRVDEDLGKSREGSRTDDEVVQREEEQIKLDGLSVAELKEMRAKAQKQEFVAEVNRMMKLIINSLYKNKEIFLRELISNASDALDKIRFMALTDKEALADNDDLSIRIKSDKDNRMLHITDTGIGMTSHDMVKYLGTIAKSQTSEFLSKLQEAQASDNKQSMSDLIGQFGVGFYSAFLVADKVIVTSKNNEDEQHIWESDSSSFTVAKDPRGNTLGRGTTVSLHLKEEAREYLEEHKLRDIIAKYSQFINFNIYLWTSKSVSEEVPVVEADEAEAAKSDEEADVQEDKQAEAATKKVTKTVWDWELMNSAKPIWQRKPADVGHDEYVDFYKSFTKDSQEPLAHTHFVAEGEVTFKSILYIGKSAPSDLFQNYNKRADSIKLYVRRVFISDTVDDLLPKYLSFVRGVVDSDDLPLNVSRETLQQNKLLKVIKKKLVRKILDMVKKMSQADFELFHKEYSTNVKLGVIEDSTNRVRLAKLLRFASSAVSSAKTASLEEYVQRMKDKQEFIYFIAGSDRAELERSPFVERLLAKGYEVLYLTDPIDEYCMQSLPEFDGKRFQNVAKEGLSIDKSKQAEDRLKELEKTYEPLVNWMKEVALKDRVEGVKVSTRLVKTPMALVANQFGYSGNMERITRAQAYQKSGGDSASQYYFGQKKILEVNPGHPLCKELLRRVESDQSDPQAKQMVELMFESATLRSGYELRDTAGFADRIEHMLRSALNVPLDEQVDEMPDFDQDQEQDQEQEREQEAEHAEEVNAEEENAQQTTEYYQCSSFKSRKLLSFISPVDASGSSVCNPEPSSTPVYPPPLSIRRIRNKKEEDEEEIDEAEDDDESESKRTIKIIGVPKLEKYKLKSSKGDKPEGCINKIEEDGGEYLAEPKLYKSNDDEEEEEDELKQQSSSREEHKSNTKDKKSTRQNSHNKEDKTTVGDAKKESSKNNIKYDVEPLVKGKNTENTKKDHIKGEKISHNDIDGEKKTNKNTKSKKNVNEKADQLVTKDIKQKKDDNMKKEKIKVKQSAEKLPDKIARLDTHELISKKKNKMEKLEKKILIDDQVDEVDINFKKNEQKQTYKQIKSKNDDESNSKSKYENKKIDKKQKNKDDEEPVTKSNSKKKDEKLNKKTIKNDEDDDEDDDEPVTKSNSKKKDEKLNKKQCEDDEDDEEPVTKSNSKKKHEKSKEKIIKDDVDDDEDDDEDDEEPVTKSNSKKKHEKSKEKIVKDDEDDDEDDDEPVTKSNSKKKDEKLNKKQCEDDESDDEKLEKSRIKPTNSLTLSRPIKKTNKIKKSEIVVSTDKLNKFRLVWNIIKSLFTIENSNLDDDEEDDIIPARNKKSEYKMGGRKGRKLLSIDQDQDHDEERVDLFKNRKFLKTNDKPSETKPTKEDKNQPKMTKNKKIKREDSESTEESKKLKKIKSEIKIPGNKKVGFEHRYRVSRFIESVKNPKFAPQIEKLDDEDQSYKNKPKVGWEHRYRITNYLQAQSGKKHRKNEAQNENKKEDYLLIGQYKIDKTKIGPIGWQYRYRATNKFKSLIKKPEKQNKKSNKILEVVEYSDNEDIPFCEGIAEDPQLLLNLAKKEENIEQDDVSDENKPKVGWQYRYRISRMFAEKNNEPKLEISKKIKKVKIEEPQPEVADKPSVGWQYRYRISKMMQALKNTPKIFKPIESAEENTLPIENKPKVGWEHRYRISRWSNHNRPAKKIEIKTKITKPVFEKKQETKESIEPKPKVGWEYRYRVSRMLAEEPNQKKIDPKKSKKQKIEEKENQIEEKFFEKPKVGFEHRYRVSKYLSSLNQKPIEIKPKKEKLNFIDVEKIVEKKPKVGWEHRYRVSKMNNEPQKEEILAEKVQEKDEVENKPKVGWQFRYRVSQKLHSEKMGKKSKKLAQKILEKIEDLPLKNENVGKIGFEFRYRLSKKASSNCTDEPTEEPEIDKKSEIARPKKKISPKKPKKKVTVIDQKPKVVFTIEYEKIFKKDHLIKKVIDKVEKKANDVVQANNSEHVDDVASSNESLAEEIIQESENQTKNDDNYEVIIEVQMEKDSLEKIVNETEKETEDEVVVDNAEVKKESEELDEFKKVELEIDIEVKKPKKSKKEKREKKKKLLEQIREEVIEEESEKIDQQVEEKKEKIEKLEEQARDEVIEKELTKIESQVEEKIEEIVNILEEEKIPEIILEQQVQVELEPIEEEELRQAEETESVDEIEIKTEIITSFSFFESIKEILANAPSFFDLEENEEVHDKVHGHDYDNIEESEESR